MQDCHPMKTPLTPSKLLPSSDDDQIVDKLQYQSMIGSLIYLSIAMHPDISTAVGILARHVERLTKQHLTAPLWSTRSVTVVT